MSKKLLLPFVDINIELVRHDPEFFLRHSGDNSKYKMVFTECKLQVPLITFPPDIEIAQAEVLQKNPALYSYIDKRVTVHSLPYGSHKFEHNNTWNGDVPSKLTVLMVPSKNYSGTYDTDPFAFEHNKCNQANFMVDNVPVGGLGMELSLTDKQETSKLMPVYCALRNSYPDIQLSRGDWFKNFPAFHFNINTSDTDDVLPLMKKGLTKLLLKFEPKLDHDTTFLLFAEFPGLLEIDAARNISL